MQTSLSILVVHRTHLMTMADRSFLVAVSRVWNNLSHHAIMITSPSLQVFKNRFKTNFFLLFLNHFILLCKVPARWLLSFWHFNRYEYRPKWLLINPSCTFYMFCSRTQTTYQPYGGITPALLTVADGRPSSVGLFRSRRVIPFTYSYLCTSGW